MFPAGGETPASFAQLLTFENRECSGCNLLSVNKIGL